jgi:CMP-N,N'-diacetyllegionaminic acid synthase
VDVRGRARARLYGLVQEEEMKTPNILGIIPARSGSKGVRNKNTVELGGLPLIAHTLRAVQDSVFNFDHIVSTDSLTIADISKKHGGQVPFKRPKYLAQDTSSTVDVVLHTLERVGKKYDYVLLLQPTCPFRSSKDIDAAIRLAIKNNASSVCSFTSVKDNHPNYMYYINNKKVTPVVSGRTGKRRQVFREAVLRNGAIYLVKTNALLRTKSFVTPSCIPYIMPSERSLNIDTRSDLELARDYVRTLN